MTQVAIMKHIPRLCLLAFAFLAASGAAHGADMAERFQARVYTSNIHGALPYRLLRPALYNKNTRYPLILFLHGVDERGTDNKKQLYCGLDIFADKKRMETYPCFIVAPQCPPDTLWADVDWKSERHTMKKKPTRALAMSIELIHELEKEFSIDSGRLYVVGYSMGGFGAWEAIQRWPDLFAAAVPVCGGGDEAEASRIVNIPLWAFHGALDTIVHVRRSRNMINAVVMAGGVPRYTEYAIINHLCWWLTFSDEKMFEWLFSQRK